MNKKIITICLVGIFFLTCISSATALLMKEETKPTVKNEEKEEQIETLTEPDYKFDSVEIELHGKAIGWSLSGTYARWWRFPILFTDYEYQISYCFKFWIKDKIPGSRLELVDGYFNITTPNGGTLIVEYDGDTRIDHVSEIVKQSRYDSSEPFYYYKGTLLQGVEIYL